MNRLSVVIGVVGSLLSCVCVCVHAGVLTSLLLLTTCERVHESAAVWLSVSVLLLTPWMKNCQHPTITVLSFFFKRPSRPACLTGQNPVRESEREGADSPLEAWQQPTPSKSLQTSTSLLLLLWASLVFSSFLFFFFGCKVGWNMTDDFLHNGRYIFLLFHM